jgi:transposase, IS5 family
MPPKKHETTGSGDLFRARLDQIINMRHELVQLAGEIDWEFIDGEIAPLYSDGGRPGIATQFVIGLFLLKHIYGLSDFSPTFKFQRSSSSNGGNCTSGGNAG